MFQEPLSPHVEAAIREAVLAARCRRAALVEEPDRTGWLDIAEGCRRLESAALERVIASICAQRAGR